MAEQNDFFLGIINAEFHHCLGNFAINQSDMSKKITSHCVLGLVWSRQLDDLSQVMQHNPRIEQALIELWIDFANSICQTHHGCSVESQTRFKGMVVGLGCWIRIEFLIVLGVKISDNSLPDRIFYFENHLRHVVTNFLDINW